MRLWQHYKALVFKNSILWRRRLVGSLLEVLLTVLMLFFIMLIREAISVEEEDAVSFVDSPISVTYDNQTLTQPDGYQYGIAYCTGLSDKYDLAFGYGPPDHPMVLKLIERIGGIDGLNLKPFESNSELDEYIEDSDYEDKQKICAAVIFEDDGTSNSYEYSIRFNQTEFETEGSDRIGEFIPIFMIEEIVATDDLIRGESKFVDDFHEYGFLQLMVWINSFILQEVTGDSSARISADFIPMKLDDYVKDSFVGLIAFLLPFFMIIAYVIPVCRMISLLVQEKEYKTKEIMMIMGLSESAYWLSWITYYFVVYTVLAFLATVLLGFGGVFSYSNAGYIFVLFWLFGLSSMALSFFLSTFFSTGRSAVMLGVMIYFVGYFLVFAVDDPNLPMSDKVAASLVPQIAFSLGIDVLAVYEGGQVGITSDTVDKELNNFTFQASLIMLFVDCIILAILAWYFEQVWPRDWGTSRPWYFLFTKSYWAPDKATTKTDFKKAVHWGDSVEPADPSLEALKEDGRAMVVRGLTKRFGGKTAVNDMNLDMYEGQIFALLGHNGAGKTTTFSMLSGLIPMTSGDMTVKGLALSKDLSKIRKHLGVCPQQNVLYNELTPAEHLRMFSVFKGMSDSETIKQKTEEMLDSLEMGGFKDRPIKFLSGGQKRKVSLALALIGDSPIVLLDEPTAGMDLTARRLMWDLLKDHKNGRIMILTTHYMEEADVLADRIAIMSEGTLRCLGSSLFLKSRYGVGYYLTIVKEPNIASDAHTAQLTDFVQRFVPEAVVMNDIHAEITLQLPLSATQAFRDFFESLDHNMKSLQLRSYGISVTTLEEVFLRVARGDDVQLQKEEGVQRQVTRLSSFTLENERDRKCTMCKHFWALIKKRLLWSKRDIKSLVFEVIVPIFIVLGGLGLMMIADRFVDPERYELSIDKYEETQSVLYATSGSSVSGLFTNADGYDSQNLGTMSISQFDEEVFDERDTDPYRMGSVYFDSVSGNDYELSIFHNFTASMAAPTYYNEICNLIVKDTSSSASIVVNNYPLPYTVDVKNLESTGDGFMAALIFSLGFSFIPAGIVAFIVKEREVNIKHQHMISGVSLFAYWFSNLAWDLMKHLIPAVVSFLLILAFDIQAFTDESESIGALFLLLVLYGFTVAVFTYLTSYMFKSYSSAQVLTLIFHFFTGSLLPIGIFIMFFFPETIDAAKALQWIFRFFPNFCFGMGLLNIGSRETFAVLDGASEPYGALDIDSAGADLLMLGVTFVLYLLLTILAEVMETNPTLRKACSRKSKVHPRQFEIDEDVQREEEEVRNTNPSDVQVNVRELRKVFGRFTAVEQVSFNVHPNECFGLLGVNGAGKTTTFKMLTGEVVPTAGDAFIGGYNVFKNLQQVRELIGYCPQFDAVSDFLTVVEHLDLYAAIKGIPSDKRARVVEEMVQHMDLQEYRDVQSRSLSGGNKRKLSTAMALIGNPSILFLDEPSAGMDPEARKKMWRIIGNLKRLNSAVILTTHSMEEAEALSDRLAIMVAGRVRCLGTATMIKGKYGDAYELELKTRLPTREQLEELTQKLDQMTSDYFITPNTIVEALQALGVPEFYSLIHPKGYGSSIHASLNTDGKVSKDALSSWVATEIMGANLQAWLSQHFERFQLTEHYLSLFRFKINKQEDKSIGTLFSLVEENKEALNISDYALSQTSLEQIFNNFARQGELERIQDNQA